MRNTETKPESVSDTPPIQGHRRVAAYLSGRLGVPISEDSVYRLSIRQHDPLPVTGFTGRVWAFPTAIDEWIARQARKPRQTRK